MSSKKARVITKNSQPWPNFGRSYVVLTEYGWAVERRYKASRGCVEVKNCGCRFHRGERDKKRIADNDQRASRQTAMPLGFAAIGGLIPGRFLAIALVRGVVPGMVHRVCVIHIRHRVIHSRHHCAVALMAFDTCAFDVTAFARNGAIGHGAKARLRRHQLTGKSH